MRRRCVDFCSCGPQRHEGEDILTALVWRDMNISPISHATRLCPTLMPHFRQIDLIYLRVKSNTSWPGGSWRLSQSPSWNPNGGRPLRDVGCYICHFISLIDNKYVLPVLIHTDSVTPETVQHWSIPSHIQWVIWIGFHGNKCPQCIDPNDWFFFSWHYIFKTCCEVWVCTCCARSQHANMLTCCCYIITRNRGCNSCTNYIYRYIIE